MLEPGGVSPGDDRELGMSSLQLRPSPQQCVIDGTRAVGTSHGKNERPFRVDPQCGFGILRGAVAQLADAVAQRHAHDRRRRGIQPMGRVGEAQKDTVDSRGQQPRHEAGTNVLFVNERRYAQQRCPQYGGERRVSARANDDLRTQSTQNR